MLLKKNFVTTTTIKFNFRRFDKKIFYVKFVKRVDNVINNVVNFIKQRLFVKNIFMLFVKNIFVFVLIEKNNLIAFFFAIDNRYRYNYFDFFENFFIVIFRVIFD